MNLLVTGGAGFIGSTYVRLARRRRPEDLVVNVDALTYAGNLENLRALEGDARHVFVRADIRDGDAMLDVDAAARDRRRRQLRRREPRRPQHHVARSRSWTPTSAARCACSSRRARRVIRRFVQISTDEVYGSLAPAGRPFDETSPLVPRNPYAASKAAADGFVTAFHHTHGMDTVITRCANNYGPRQFPEKLIP